MTVLSMQTIRRLGIMTPCHERTRHDCGLTFGLSAAGYDLTIKDEIELASRTDADYYIRRGIRQGLKGSAFVLAVAQEHFSMPPNVLGRVCDKSTLARQGIQLFNTVIEPGWRGFLTLEIANHSDSTVRLLAGQPIAQVVFELLDEPSERPYEGRYQDQPYEPVAARFLQREEAVL